MKTGDQVTLRRIDTEKRGLSARNHSAHIYCRKRYVQYLETHVEQAGSLNNDHRLRFDFTHFSAMTKEELEKNGSNCESSNCCCVSGRMCEHAYRGSEKDRAQALFGEKYGDVVL